jgi:hypothetical protein
VLRGHGVNLAEITAITEAIAEVLPGRVLTREELTDAVLEHTWPRCCAPAGASRSNRRAGSACSATARPGEAMLVIEGIGGLGKSALAWEWLRHHAAHMIKDRSGTMWWSCHEGSASMVRFLLEAAGYLTGRPIAEYSGLDAADLLGTVTDLLRKAPCLLVLDGFERLLTAYHTFDPTKLRDDEVDI